MSFSRRTGSRANGRGRIATVAGASGPPPEATGVLAAIAEPATSNFTGTVVSNLPLAGLTIAPGWTVYLVGDVGLGDVAGTLTWADQSGGSFDATMAIAGNKPTVTASVLNGRTGLTFDGGVQFMQFSGLNLPAPGTTPAWIFSVWRWKTWTSGDNLYTGGATNCMRLRQGGSTPQVAKTNGTVGASLSPVLNTWQCSEDYYSNSAADYLRVGATSTAAADSGNNDPGAGIFRLGSSNGGGLGSPDADMVFFGILPRLPTGTEITNLRAWVTSMWGGSVAV